MSTRRFAVVSFLVGSMALLADANAQNCIPAELPEMLGGLPLAGEVRTETAVAAIYVGDNEYYRFDAYPRPQPEDEEPGLWQRVFNQIFGEDDRPGPACPYPCPLDAHAPEGVMWLSPLGDPDWELSTWICGLWLGEVWRKKDSDPPVHLSNTIMAEGDDECLYGVSHAVLIRDASSERSDPDAVWRELLDAVN